MNNEFIDGIWFAVQHIVVVRDMPAIPIVIIVINFLSLSMTFNVCSYGSKYYYCHIDETHMPKDSEELQKAIKEYNKKFI